MANLKITLKHGLCGANPKQRAAAQTLTLRKIGKSVVREDTPAVRGTINVIRHLVEVEEVD